jgi:hypothetical protein
MKSILSVDLASRRYRDIGIAVVSMERGEVRCQFVPLEHSGLQGPPSAEIFASFLKGIAEEANADIILIDGPQGWKDPANGLEHSRVCERLLFTQGKTGLPGSVKPASWTYMAQFSIELFDALDVLGFPRVEDLEQLRPGKKLALESFPTSAWRTLNLKPLPGKKKDSGIDVQTALASLVQLVPIRIGTQPTHDELQALIAALAGLPLLGFDSIEFSLFGNKPVRIGGTWREGFIVNPVLAAR